MRPQPADATAHASALVTTPTRTQQTQPWRCADWLQGGSVPEAPARDLTTWCWAPHLRSGQPLCLRRCMLCPLRVRPQARQQAAAASRPSSTAGARPSSTAAGGEPELAVLCSPAATNKFMACDGAKNLVGSYYHVRVPETQVRGGAAGQLPRRQGSGHTGGSYRCMEPQRRRWGHRGKGGLQQASQDHAACRPARCPPPKRLQVLHMTFDEWLQRSAAWTASRLLLQAPVGTWQLRGQARAQDQAESAPQRPGVPSAGAAAAAAPAEAAPPPSGAATADALAALAAGPLPQCAAFSPSKALWGSLGQLLDPVSSPTAPSGDARAAPAASTHSGTSMPASTHSGASMPASTHSGASSTHAPASSSADVAHSLAASLVDWQQLGRLLDLGAWGPAGEASLECGGSDALLPAQYALTDRILCQASSWWAAGGQLVGSRWAAGGQPVGSWWAAGGQLAH